MTPTRVGADSDAFVSECRVGRFGRFGRLTVGPTYLHILSHSYRKVGLVRLVGPKTTVTAYSRYYRGVPLLY